VVPRATSSSYLAVWVLIQHLGNTMYRVVSGCQAISEKRLISPRAIGSQMLQSNQIAAA
jgi:hypothetical protein